MARHEAAPARAGEAIKYPEVLLFYRASELLTFGYFHTIYTDINFLPSLGELMLSMGLSEFVQVLGAILTIASVAVSVTRQPSSEIGILGLYLLVGFVVFCVALLIDRHLREQ
jgi:hypothetical protein